MMESVQMNLTFKNLEQAQRFVTLLDAVNDSVFGDDQELIKQAFSQMKVMHNGEVKDWSK